jgi:putative phosphoesterase
MSGPLVVGVIADTHGIVRPEVHDALKGVYLILHAGDVGGDEVLDELGLIAPVAAVMGNTDPPGHPRLVERIDRTIEGVRIHVSHGHELGVPRPDKLLKAYDADVVIYGHTHVSLVNRVDGRLLLNPGAAGPRRFDTRPSLARLTLHNRETAVELIEL